MRNRLAFLLLLSVLLSGCGSAAPMETMPGAVDDGYQDYLYQSPSNQSQSLATEAPGDVSISESDETNLGSYFTFTRGNSARYADDGTTLLYEYTCDTQYISEDLEQEQWVDSILAEISLEYNANSENLLVYAQNCLEQGSGNAFYGFSNYQDIGVVRHDSKVTSLVVLSSIYSGGTHPNSLQTAWNLDMENRMLLTLNDVLYEGSESSLTALTLQKVDEKFNGLSQDVLFSDYQQTISEYFNAEDMTPYWYLNTKGLVVFFNQYELGPYAAGIIKAEIPYEALAGILREEYFPDESNHLSGDLCLLDTVDGKHQISVLIKPDGTSIAIGIDGEVQRLQISEVFWLEDTPIGQKMMFSADRLSEETVLVITGGFDDETRSIAIEFMDDNGDLMLYYLHPYGLTTTP